MQAVGKRNVLLAVGRKECYMNRELSQCRVDLRYRYSFVAKQSRSNNFDGVLLKTLCTVNWKLRMAYATRPIIFLSE
jgi:hypothetical protein